MYMHTILIIKQFILEISLTETEVETADSLIGDFESTVGWVYAGVLCPKAKF